MARVVDQGFCCVDLRKFFVPTDQTTWKPTKTGIALRLNEWPTFKQAIDHNNPTVANFTPCFTPNEPARVGSAPGPTLGNEYGKTLPLPPQPGPHHSRDHGDLSRVQSVSFNHRVTVYPADDYDRKSAWMYTARRRQQFTLRIQQMEFILAPILNDVRKIRMRHLAFADIVF